MSVTNVIYHQQKYVDYLNQVLGDGQDVRSTNPWSTIERYVLLRFLFLQTSEFMSIHSVRFANGDLGFLDWQTLCSKK